MTTTRRRADLVRVSKGQNISSESKRALKEIGYVDVKRGIATLTEAGNEAVKRQRCNG